ncbi:Uncharacterised protein [Mycobacteroides abscessus subsp. abscessus]|nr:Uncharacterised protein [Mycobacteroides abscessus subsp. abscessus]
MHVTDIADDFPRVRALASRSVSSAPATSDCRPRRAQGSLALLGKRRCATWSHSLMACRCQLLHFWQKDYGLTILAINVATWSPE